MKRTTWNFFSGSQLTFGPGAVGTLTSVVGRRMAKRVLVVGDQRLRSAGIIDQVDVALQRTSAEIEIFDSGEEEPTIPTVTALGAAVSQFHPDLMVAVGGGSNMDLAKVAAALATNPSEPESLFGFDQIALPTLPLVCLPTTAGTGSEVSHAAVIKSPTTGMKTSIQSQYLRPAVAIVDPQLTVSCPETVSVASGMDALTHAIEAYLVANFYTFDEDFDHGLAYEGNHPLADLYAEKAIALIAANLKRVHDDPDHLGSRSAMAYAATLAGVAFSSSGVCLAHALEYPIGMHYGSSHGAGNALVLPEVMRFWIPQRADRLAKIAKWMGVPNADQMESVEAAEAAVGAVGSLRDSIGLPKNLGEIGGVPGDIGKLTEATLSLQRLIQLSPRQPNQHDIEQILSRTLPN